MESFDVAIVGGGPAGSSCAWGLRDSGLRVAILDRARFPRHKTCGGWITPQVLTALQINVQEYARGRVLQPISGFRTSVLGSRHLETRYDVTVSYGIRRCEFDSYLLARSRATVFEGVDARSVRREGAGWTIADRFQARVLVGAGGHFCPIARMQGASPAREPAVLAQEAEFALPAREAGRCRISGETPELYFCPDLKGYGWCFRKGDFLNVGFGRLETQGIPRQVTAFLEFLGRAGRLALPLPENPRGHAYLLYGSGSRQNVDDAVLLAGDAAGLAYAQSGEGIRPAVESGLLAARCIAAAQGNYDRKSLAPYREMLRQRFGDPRLSRLPTLAGRLTAPAIRFAVREVMGQPWLTRRVILDRWFLHRSDAAFLDTGRTP